ncbi:alanine dehydrogenase [Spongiibacter taiwanensis]|uniref:alanine dehydrogenase n=1 Tax=Spongiibacter taiwanensis TaxID=1748242 RepID=UPI002034E76E|nr:alanine dehydrogenase [Spongiibacter taiwanensis]USA44435.1 alanine dehydrogenase [Spongiibacter taiwanensis]
MRIGVPKEIKNHEYRVGLTPASCRELVARGHSVCVEHNAGSGIGFSDQDYRDAGASIAREATEIFAEAELLVKVKEPQPHECKLLGAGQLLFTYLHLAPDPEQAKGLLASGVAAIAYETITDDHGNLPCLAPMSEVAGRLAPQAGAHHLEKAAGGRGVLLGGVPGVSPAEVCVLGGGIVGYNAARIAAGMGASVTVYDRSPARLRWLDSQFQGRVICRYATQSAIDESVRESDLVIGAVLIPGASAPKLVRRALLGEMRAGSVLVDVAIDQGGCFETSKPTTHQNPTYVVDGIIHYCVANMPGAVARTATLALNNATLPFTLAMADRGLQALRDDPHLRNGLNIFRGNVCHPAVADSLGMTFLPAEKALNG